MLTGIMNFRHMLEKYRQQLVEIEKLVSSQMLGVFLIKFDSLKEVMRASSRELLLLVEKTIAEY